MHPGVGHHVAPLQTLAVEIGVAGEAQAGPHVAPDVLHPALDLSLGLRPVGLAQADVKTHSEGEVQHPQVPGHLALAVFPEGHHLGVVVEAAAGHAAEILEGVDVALDEGGGVGFAHQFHVSGPRPAHGHHEYPDAMLATVLIQVGQAAPVHLGLLSRSCLEPHRRLEADRPCGGASGIRSRCCRRPRIPAPATPATTPRSSPNLPPTGGRCAGHTGSNADPRGRRGLGRMASGDLRYFNTVLRAKPSSRAMDRAECPSPCIS